MNLQEAKRIPKISTGKGELSSQIETRNEVDVMETCEDETEARALPGETTSLASLVDAMWVRQFVSDFKNLRVSVEKAATDMVCEADDGMVGNAEGQQPEFLVVSCRRDAKQLTREICSSVRIYVCLERERFCQTL